MPKVKKDPVIEVTERAMACSIKRTHEALKTRLNSLATIGATAPFVGLFGTVIGIINSFRGSIGPSRAASMGAVAGGISEALITTSLGLLVAIPAVWAYNYLANRLDTFDMEMAHSVDATLTYLHGLRESRRDRQVLPD